MLSRTRTAMAVAAVLAFGLAACSKDDGTPPATDTSTAAPAPGTEQDTPAAAAAALAALPVDELKQRASAAVRDQRLHSPSGDSAIEYYLAIRDKAGTGTDVSAESALIDLMPYALIAAEKAVMDNNFPEAERLLSLMEKADPEAPSLPRVRDALTAARTALAEREAEETERQRVAEEQRAREAAAARRTATAPAPAATPPPAAAAPATEPAATEAAPAPETNPAPQTATPTPATTPEPTTAAAPTAGPTVNRNPRPISQPQPQYPREAARAGTAGQVVVRYTISADGRVTDVEIVSSRPRGVFDRAVVAAVERWRFEAPGEPITQTRTLDFRM